MSLEPTDPRLPFFNALAERWDSLQNLEELPQRLARTLAHFQVDPRERILEVGCGTGNLTRTLTLHLGEAGRIFAVDGAPRMLEKAQTKVQDPRVTWIQARIQDLPEALVELDRAILMGVWPHLDDKAATLNLLRQRLRPMGRLHIWHLAGREHINRIHAGAHPAVSGDLLEPARELADLLPRHGFQVLELQDDASEYCVSALRT